MSDIRKEHSEYKKRAPIWRKIADILEGQEYVKSKGETYLPYPVPLTSDERATPEFASRYEVYISNASFTEFSQSAVDDLVSSAFRRPVRVDPQPPKELEYFDFQILAKHMTRTICSYGRGFIMADYPKVDESVKVAQDGDNAAYVVSYDAIDVINWEVSMRSGVERLIRVVIKESDVENPDEFGIVPVQYRELKLVAGIYTVNIYRLNEDGTDYEIDESYTPLANGKEFNYIPATFIGTTSNTIAVDKSPIIGIVNSNILHYRTTAELFHTQTYNGHPQLVATGLNTGFVEELTRLDREVKVDAASVLLFEGENSDAKLLEMNQESLIHFKTLDYLKESMLEQGARIKSMTNSKSGVESAGAIQSRYSADVSKLGAIVVNVSDALEQSFEWIGEFMGVKYAPSAIINSVFYLPNADSQIIMSLDNAISNGNAPEDSLIEYMLNIELLTNGITKDEYMKRRIERPEITREDGDTPDVEGKTTDNKGGEVDEKKTKARTEAE